MEKMEIERFPILRFTEQGRNETEDIVTKETPVTIILNDRELVTLLCSPANLEYLAIGFLFSEGLLKSKDEIKNIIADERRGVVRVETEKNKEFTGELLFKPLIASSGGRGASFYSASDIQDKAKVESQIAVAPDEVFALVNEFQHRSRVFKATGGVHSAALCDTEGILVFSEDIGRHNAIDKVFGECILTDIPTDDCMIITSGRVSSDILLKVAKRKIPILISKSAPTDLGVRLADDLGITLIGFVRGKRMNVYTNRWRVVTQKHE
jgi:FdhD protein